MNQIDLLIHQVASAGSQLDKVFSGLTEDAADFRPTPKSMSARETAIHLADCYAGAQRVSQGEEPQWNTYKVSGDQLSDAIAAMTQERQRAIQALRAASEEKQTEIATEYILLHDAYHVGQMVTLRQANDESWDPYSIY